MPKAKVDELAEVLTAISQVAARLAKEIIVIQSQMERGIGNERTCRKAVECCCGNL